MNAKKKVGQIYRPNLFRQLFLLVSVLAQTLLAFVR